MAVTPRDVASGRGNAAVASAVVPVHGHGGPLEVPVIREPTAGDVARAPGEPTGLPTAHAGSAVLGTTVVGSRHDRMPTLAQRMGNGTAFVTAPPAVSGGRGVAGAGVQQRWPAVGRDPPPRLQSLTPNAYWEWSEQVMTTTMVVSLAAQLVSRQDVVVVVVVLAGGKVVARVALVGRAVAVAREVVLARRLFLIERVVLLPVVVPARMVCSVGSVVRRDTSPTSVPGSRPGVVGGVA